MSHPTHTSFDVAVVGGGVCGLVVAWRARARGLSVVVLDRGELGAGTSRVAAGMLAPVTEADAGERDLLTLGLQSARRWPSFAAELEDVTGIDVGYRETGTIVAARDGDEAAALERELELRERLGLRAEWLAASEARKLEPALAPVLRSALEVPGDHSVDPHALLEALVAATGAAGVVLRPGAAVTRLLVDGGRVTGVELDGGEIVAADRTVVAAGAWSGAELGLPAAARIPVRPVKGQILTLRDGSGPGLLTRVLRYEHGYVVPRGDGRYVVGATQEERGFDSSVTALGVYELLRYASELLPGLLELEVGGLAAGLRPGTPDNAPVLGAGALEGLCWATGHHRGGILLAPVTGDLLAAELAGEERVPAPFAAERFAGVAA